MAFSFSLILTGSGGDTDHNSEHIIRYVTAGVADGVGGGVGEDDGGGGGGEGVPGGLHRGVRQVHDQPQLVHLLHHSLQRIYESFVQSTISNIMWHYGSAVN